MVEGIRRTADECVSRGDARPAGSRVDFLPTPFGKGGAGADVAGESNALGENAEIRRFREVIGIDEG
jgi:hypothetical protein